MLKDTRSPYLLDPFAVAIQYLCAASNATPCAAIVVCGVIRMVRVVICIALRTGVIGIVICGTYPVGVLPHVVVRPRVVVCPRVVVSTRYSPSARRPHRLLTVGFVDHIFSPCRRRVLAKGRGFDKQKKRRLEGVEGGGSCSFIFVVAAGRGLEQADVGSR
ncbi:hypothetical protein BJ912DRAFT_365702 [Pholiota molesta]|jgi:hypothetical protein|nr:hypothetical protein BJ912DRAFT_365702 [Pholiota molesta]